MQPSAAMGYALGGGEETSLEIWFAGAHERMYQAMAQTKKR